MPHFTQTLLDWYAQNGRDLPWRDTTDPYRIWISEIILQQTRVAQGYDYFLRFVRRFPTVDTLAAASQDEVMQQWEGLGYYSRARNLHAAARQIVEHGTFPTDYAGVRALKGVGDYTAAAICSFAYGLPTAVVDGNVYRVLARHFGLSTPIDTTAGKKQFADLAARLIDPHRPAAYNQAIMDFGAIQCTPRSPRCLVCPLAGSCAALAAGTIETLPVKSKKTAVAHRHFVYFILQTTEGEMLVHRRPTGDIWAGLYEPPLLEFPEMPSLATLVDHPAVRALGPGLTFRPVVLGLTHVLTHRRIHADCYLVTHLDPARLAHHPLWGDYRRLSLAERSTVAFPRLVNILFDHLDLRE